MSTVRGKIGALILVIGVIMFAIGQSGSGGTLTVWAWIIGGVGLVLLLSGYVGIVNTSKTSPLEASARGPHPGEPQPGARTPRPAAPDEEFTGTIRRIRNNNVMRGAHQFGTDVIVDVVRDSGVVQGYARQYFTPVQIANLTPGTTVRLTAGKKAPDEYLIILDEWEELT